MKPMRLTVTGRYQMRSAWSIGALLHLFCLLSLSTGPLDAQEAAGRAKPKRYARDVHLQIETDRTTYRVDDSIRVRVSLVNTSDHRIAFFSGGVQYDAELIVSGSDGRRVKPTMHKRPPASTSGAPAVLLPRQTAAWGWTSDKWMPLAYWGYQLREPGQYTIRGLPRLTYPGLVPDHKTVRSNTVTITLTP